MKTDRQLLQDVLDELAWEPSLDEHGIAVATDDGIVTMTGRVPSYGERYSAAKAAERVLGVRAVVNELMVRLTPLGERQDEDIAESVLHAFDLNQLVPAEKLKVVVQNGWVGLDGEVEWMYQKEQAEKSIRNLLGVRGIDNRIVVKPWVKIGDVKHRIEDALKRTVDAEFSNIDVKIDGSEITLSGTVRSWAEKYAAERAAGSAKGVTKVHSLLAINAFAFA